jgi:hypothetical protein
MQMKALRAMALLGVGMVLAGCKSAPDLTQPQALALIQANYDHATPVGADIVVDDLGMRQGATGKLWDRTTIYPNKFWADFKLTDAGKKAVQLPGGGDVIQWRPSSLTDTSYSIRLVSVAANHLKARDIGDISDEMVAGVDVAKGANYVEGVDLTGAPDLLQTIAHNPGNQLVIKRRANFALVNGAWTLHSIQ